MPRFSVIVPVYKVQAYLHACLESVLDQSFTDFELVAVDDCSPDGSGAIVDEFAARDPRVTAVHLPENTGLGPARNAGLERATGEYVIFLDSDDSLTQDALQAISDRLKDTDGPDVLVYDYVRTYWTGRTVPNSVAAQLTEAGPAVFTLADRPGLLKVLHVAWNKAYRREFLERGGFAFAPGYYEDVSWTYPVLLTAESIAVLDRVCVHYRQRRQGAITSTPGSRHFEIFDQYDRVFAYLDAHPELAEWRPHVFRRMIDHFSTVFTARGRVPRGSRGAFLRRTRTYCRRYRSSGATPRLRTRIRHALVGMGAHRTYRALCSGRTFLRRVRRVAAAGHHAVRAAALQVHYRAQRCLPLRENDAVFSAYWGRGYGCNPAAIEEKARELVPGIRTAWIADPAHHHTVPTATRRLTPGTAAYWTALARSKYLVNNVNFDRRLVKRRGQVFLQTQHGTPLKHMGLDLLDRPAAVGDTDVRRTLANCDKWDYVLSANRHSTLVWERVYPASYTTLEYGYPRNDVYQQATSTDVARLRETLGIPRDSVAILYAPTHRDYRRTQRHPLDLDRLLRALGPSFTVLTRAHHLYGTPLAGEGSSRLVDVSDHPCVESLCLASDVLLTDYSSLMFDYANLDRPIVVYADDWAAYEAARGTYFDLRRFSPGAIAFSEDELIDVFATGEWRSPHSAQRRAAFRERFCPYDDGGAAERVVRHVFLGETAGLPSVVPLEERQPAAVPTAFGPRQEPQASVLLTTSPA
ncbi:bifunctional glycosyltransferase family 2 protein/CDP-glycerol:glycerophosphate glycerophosphotransferase [Streptomyces sp. PSKA54]|uniref:Bifunctional glycosyltransferase family 2 protein/CDP-glycerol:glycerophosphate glycerophosphotransferase n=1 Tax=Streptomyces himalayensis subsp. aureolus TaxID=2758039 RepID=A0A7W2CWS5_9ACTN|nr:bifunctional glycosyltransferase family 2 protein/CDP-glycerol:glycerophosphate glycerophosphotransferase [Streptomyces himalayensis]MBA4860320.1 bifunctional glycosyltransferase family 2 protein/CDP-glycerol:glycerophosphate glycerophosphotransferase [Streptomyces himalayensis subsp. aureolus]